MSLTGTYNPATNGTTVTISGEPAGSLVIYQREVGDPRARATIVDTNPTYDGGTWQTTTYRTSNGTSEYYAFIDGDREATVQVTATLTACWLISIQDSDTNMTVRPVRDRSDSWRERRRRGWTGDVIGSTRTVGVADVSMSARSGRVDLYAISDSEMAALDQLLSQGFVVFRPMDRVKIPGGLWLVMNTRDRPNPGQGGRMEVEWTLTWFAGERERLPDE